MTTRAEEKTPMLTLSTPTVSTLRFDPDQIECDIVLIRYLVVWSQNVVTPHDLLFTPRNMKLTFDFTHYFPTRYIFTSHLAA